MSLTLFNRGVQRVADFCTLNNIPRPRITKVLKADWYVNACAYYRPRDGIKICTECCAHSCSEGQTRNWNWPASVTDREPFGVICHELGHHCDHQTGQT